MRRHIHRLRAGIQHDFQQIPAVQSQNRPSVRMNIADQFQPPGKLFRFLQPGKQKKAVHLSYPIHLLINGTDLPCHHKPGLSLRHALLTDAVCILQDVQPFFCGFQLLQKFLPPRRMGEVSRPYEINPLFARPKIQMLHITVLAGCAGISGVDMQIRYVRFMYCIHFLLPSARFPAPAKLRGEMRCL